MGIPKMDQVHVLRHKVQKQGRASERGCAGTWVNPQGRSVEVAGFDATLIVDEDIITTYQKEAPLSQTIGCHVDLDRSVSVRCYGWASQGFRNRGGRQWW
jgi:hypothetical protein